MKISGFDELNTPKIQVEEPEEYFSKMEISDRQKEERVDASKELRDVLLFFFALLAIQIESGGDLEWVYTEFTTRYGNVVRKYARLDEYIETYIREKTTDIQVTTLSGMGTEWYTSVDRALLIGENEANSILNYEDYQRAVEAGYRYKEWRGVMDARERHSHVKMEGVKIPIEDYFMFDDCFMFAPHDEVNGTPEQTANCRCSVRYTRN